MSLAASPQTPASEQLDAADALLIVLTIAGGLICERTVELPAQMAVGVLVWAVLLRFLHRARGDLRVLMLGCLAWSTAGEIFCSLVWGIYKYRLYNIPLFVPPGHVLMMLLAFYVGARLPRLCVTLAPAVAIGYALYAAGTGTDLLSVLLTPVLIAVLVFARNRELYAATFLLAAALELYGTRLGNWLWMPNAPVLDLSMANPPLCIGAAYCLRDALASITLRLSRRADSTADKPVIVPAVAPSPAT